MYILYVPRHRRSVPPLTGRSVSLLGNRQVAPWAVVMAKVAKVVEVVVVMVVIIVRRFHEILLLGVEIS